MEGEVLWRASADRAAGLNVTRFMAWLADRGHAFGGYEDLREWSVADLPGFWGAVRDYFGLMYDGDPEPVMTADPMPGTRWLPGARLNYAEHVLRHETQGDPARPMLHHASELRTPAVASWAQVAGDVRRLATRLRAMGVGPGDVVAAWMPNLPETVVAMLAATAIGAVWSSAAPEFGAQTVIDRFGQIAPKLVFAVNGYRYGGKDFDRSADLARILAALPSVRHVVMLDYLPGAGVPDGALRWGDLLAGPEVPRHSFRYERVACDHPLWVLFTSGTTGLPKPIVHGHHGIVLEHLKTAAFHFELQPGGALFFYSTTGWMVWNTLMWGPMMNGRAVLYDGHPAHPDARLLWRIAAETRASVMGVSPTFVQIMRQQGVQPGAEFDLSALQAVMLVGSPATPESFAWVHQAVKADLWVSSQSGGTEFCSGLLAGSPLMPTRAGEIGGAALGVDAVAMGEDGVPVTDEVAELVIRQPMPSMPLRLWGDDGSRYRDSYFDVWPGLWRHGDRVRFNAHGGAFVLGRSDATLNRYGVRIGSAEIYRTMEGIAGVADSLIVCIEDGKGGFWMPLFVQLSGVTLEAVRDEIVRRLKAERSPRHVPDEIIACPEIPMTLTGKKMEVPVRKLLMGMPVDRVASRDATRNPTALDWFADFAKARGMRAADVFDVRGRVAFVTGAAAGLGRAMAQALTANGARVVLFDRDGDGVRATAASLGATAVQGDVTDRAAVDAAVADIVAHHGRLDICIANAGVSDAAPGLVQDMGDGDWNRVIGVNLTGVMHTCRAALGVMAPAQKGKLVTVASMWGLAAPAGVFPRPAYAASKGAVVNLTREMALQYAAHGIQVNALCPGIFQTAGRPRDPAAAVAYTPMGRLGRPEELAGATLFLCSAASDFMTGQTLVIDGGVLAR